MRAVGRSPPDPCGTAGERSFHRHRARQASGPERFAVPPPPPDLSTGGSSPGVAPCSPRRRRAGVRGSSWSRSYGVSLALRRRLQEVGSARPPWSSVSGHRIVVGPLVNVDTGWCCGSSPWVAICEALVHNGILEGEEGPLGPTAGPHRPRRAVSPPTVAPVEDGGLAGSHDSMAGHRGAAGEHDDLVVGDHELGARAPQALGHLAPTSTWPSCPNSARRYSEPP